MVARKHAIAVDLDDVLFDFTGNFFEWHNQRYGTSFTEADLASGILWDLWGGTRADAQERIPRFWSEIDHLSIQPMPGSREALRLLDQHFRLVLISARDPADSPLTGAWLDKYFGNSFEQIRLGISNPMAGSMPLSKAQVCQELGARTLIDDQLIHAEECIALGIRVILLGRRAWNRGDGLPDGVQRAEDWSAVVRALGIDD